MHTQEDGIPGDYSGSRIVGDYSGSRIVGDYSGSRIEGIHTTTLPRWSAGTPGGPIVHIAHRAQGVSYHQDHGHMVFPCSGGGSLYRPSVCMAPTTTPMHDVLHRWYGHLAYEDDVVQIQQEHTLAIMTTTDVITTIPGSNVSI